jgi:SAM-dependent methyltransferase
MDTPGIFSFNNECFIRVVDGNTIISNPRMRVHVEVNADTAHSLLLHPGGLSQSAWEKLFCNCIGADRTQRFLGSAGLVTDHSGFQKNVTNKSAKVNGAELYKLLRDRLILVENPCETNSYVALMGNLLDQAHLGSFHQRVGQFVLLGLRERETWRAWQNQKFSEDGLRLIGENYRQIQEPFFDNRFTKQDLSALKILDFGCGNGYFSAKFADAGANVIALDSSEELMTLARKNYGHRKGLDFVLAQTLQDSITYLNDLEAGSINLIYLQDTLLLLLNPEGGVPSDILSELFKAYRRVLTPDGELCAMEPNSIFWLAGRYGESDNPYAVVTEYRNHVFNVVPNLGEMLQPLAETGFGLVEYCHPQHTEPAHPDYMFVKEFPIWDFMRFKVVITK